MQLVPAFRRLHTRRSIKDHCAAGDKTLRLWALGDGSCLKTFEGHTASVLRLNFLSAGTQVSCWPPAIASCPALFP